MADLLYKPGDNLEGVKAIEDVPEVMRAVVTRGDGQVHFRPDYLTPHLEPRGALVKVYTSGICHTDISARDGKMLKHMGVDPNGAKFRVLGHEFAGQVVAVGPEGDGSLLGKNVVALALYGFCGICQNDERGQYNLCRKAVFTGIQRDGGLADYFAIEHGQFLQPLPDNVSPKDAFLVGDALLTARHALEIIDTNHQDWLAVYGATGGLGLAVVINALSMGVDPKKIWAVDVRSDHLQTLEKRLGVHVIDSQGKPVAKQILQESGYRLNRAVDAFGSGGKFSTLYDRLAAEGLPADKNAFEAMVTGELSRGTVMDAYNALIRGGALAVIGARFGEYSLWPTINWMGTEKTITGPWGGPMTTASEVISYMGNGQITPEHVALLKGAEHPLTEDGVREAFEKFEGGKVMGRVFFDMDR